MLRLSTLGGLAIEADGHPVAGAAAQRRRLALLAFLAAVAPRGVSRDKLFAYLWPESDIERARNLLSQALFAFRRDFGPDAVIAPPAGDVRLNVDVVSCDLVEFDRALSRTDFERAVELYRGPFLDGVHIADAPEFERWVDAERMRFAHRHADALESLASAASARGDLQSAISWWRRLASINATSSRVALGLMNALAESGDRSGALQHARLHETLLREELGVEPDEAIVALVKRLRDARDATPSRSSRSARSESRPSSAPELSDGSSFSDPMRKSVGAAVVPNDDAHRQRFSELGANEFAQRPSTRERDLRRRRFALTSVVSVALVGISALMARELHSRGSTAGPDAAAGAIVVLPFSVEATGRFAYLGDGIVELLRRDLERANGLRVIDMRGLTGQRANDRLTPDAVRALAGRLGGRRLVVGSITEAAGRLRITASVDDTRGGTELRPLIVEGQAADAFHLVDQLAAQLLAVLYNKPAERLERAGALTSHSFDALVAYLEGEGHYRARRWADAIAAFQTAIAADSDFALAYYRLSLAADWGGRPDLVANAIGRAYEKSGQLGWHDSVLVNAYHARLGGAVAEAEQLYRAALRSYPEDVEAWYQLGELLFHQNQARGRSFTEARQPFERVLDFVPNDADVLVHLFRIASRQRDLSAIKSLGKRVLSDATPGDALEARVMLAFLVGDSAEQARALSDLRSADISITYNSVWRLSTFGRDFAGAERVSRVLINPNAVASAKAEGHEFRADLFAALGRWRDARRELDSLARYDADGAAYRRAVFSTIPTFPGSRVELAGILDSLERLAKTPQYYRSNSSDPALDLYVVGLLSSHLGDFASALRNAEALDTLTRIKPSARSVARSLSASLRAHVAWLGHHDSDALAALSAVAEGHATPPPFLDAYDRFALAEVLRESRRLDESLGWYDSIADISIQQLPFLGPSLLRQAQVYDQLGKAREAISRYREFIELWGGCDPELAPLVAEARGRIAALSGKSAG